MPTEENQNVQTGGNANMGDQSSTDNTTDNTVENNIDIDLNLDGLDIPMDSKPNVDTVIEKNDDEGIQNTESLNEASNDNDSDSDDRLVQEDKKVEELQQEDIKIKSKIEEDEDTNMKQNEMKLEAEDKKEDGIKLEEVKEEESENVEDIILEDKQDETIESMMEPLDEEELENLDIPENSEIDNADVDDVKETEINEDNGVEDNEVEDNEVEDNEVEDKIVENKQEESSVNLPEDNIDDVKVEELEVLDSVDESTEIEQKNSDIMVDSDTTVSDIQKEDTAVEGQLDLNNLDFAENTGEENIGEENMVNNDELHVENLGEDIVENTQGDIVSDTGDAKVNEGDYIPNEHDFSQITTAMDTAKPGGEIDLGELKMNDDSSNNLEVGSDVNNEIIDNNQMQGGVDLDSMIADLGNTDGLDAEKIIETPVVEPVINEIVEPAPAVNVSAAADVPVVNVPVVDVAPVQNNIPVQNQPVVVSEPQHIKSKHTGLKVLLAVIVLLVGLIFILSKMYPEEVGDIMSAMKGGDTTVVEYSDNANSNADLSETVVDSDLPLVDEINTGAEDTIDPDSLAGQIDDQNTDNIVVAEENTNIDGLESTGSAENTGFDAFADIDGVMDIPSGENAELLDKLSTYKEQGSDYNEWGRTINNTTAMKYGSFILKKAGELITSIENNEQIDNTKVDKYFAQFDKYLEKLDGLRTSIDGESQDDALVSTGIDESNTENTIGTDTVQ